MLNDPAHLDWVRELPATVPLLTSVCTGSLVYAAAGLLIGRKATTHWGLAQPALRAGPHDHHLGFPS
jgi:transcriptional regulator GlxA family with amidase domain